MFYYTLNIGDYVKETGHLTPLEDLAYRRLRDRYHTTEKPFPIDLKRIALLIRMTDYTKEVESVLNEFFIKTSRGYRHPQWDLDIEKYQMQKVHGAKGGQAKALKSRQGVGSLEAAGSQPETGNREPETDNREPEPKTINPKESHHHSGYPHHPEPAKKNDDDGGKHQLKKVASTDGALKIQPTVRTTAIHIGEQWIDCWKTSTPQFKEKFITLFAKYGHDPMVNVLGQVSEYRKGGTLERPDLLIKYIETSCEVQEQ